MLRPISVQVAHSERDVAVRVFGLGTVEARIESKIGFKVAGVLAEIDANVGDCVAKGAVLARLDSREQIQQALVPQPQRKERACEHASIVPAAPSRRNSIRLPNSTKTINCCRRDFSMAREQSAAPIRERLDICGQFEKFKSPRVHYYDDRNAD